MLVSNIQGMDRIKETVVKYTHFIINTQFNMSDMLLLFVQMYGS